jgi:hypothetical protein
MTKNDTIIQVHDSDFDISLRNYSMYQHDAILQKEYCPEKNC